MVDKVVIAVAAIVNLFFFSIFLSQECRSLEGSIEILDLERDRSASVYRSESKLDDEDFDVFVKSVLKQFDGTRGATCTGRGAQDRRRFDLTFVRIPLTSSPDLLGPFAGIVAKLLAGPDRDGRKRVLRSPWAKAIQRPDDCSVRAVLVWNERQVLADQAALAGMPVEETVDPQPFSDQDFEGFAADYAASVLLAPRDAEAEARRAIARRMPAELLWLFSMAWQSDRAPFVTFAQAALEKALERARLGYARVTVSALDAFLASGQADAIHSGLASLGRPASFGEYRIGTLR